MIVPVESNSLQSGISQCDSGSMRKVNMTLRSILCDFSKHLPGVVSRPSTRRDQITKLLQLGSNINDGEKINYLDIGTGGGLIPCVMSESGWASFGIDDFVDRPDLMSLASPLWTKYGCQISKVSLTEGVQLEDYLSSFPEPFFHIISMLDVLEHLPGSPKRVMNLLWNHIKPNGFLYIEVPNHAMLKNRVRLLTGHTVNVPFDYYWRSEPFRGHHREYTTHDILTLSNLLSNCNLREIKTIHKLADYSDYNKFLITVYKILSSLFPNGEDSIRIVLQKNE